MRYFLLMAIFLFPLALSAATPKVVASHYPLGILAQGALGVPAQILIPAGVDAHDYEPSPQVIKALYQADVILYHGESMEPWIEKLAPELEEKGKILLELDALLAPDSPTPGKTAVPEPETELHKGHDAHHHGGLDPHFWLDPSAMAKASQRIRHRLESTGKFLEFSNADSSKPQPNPWEQQLNSLDQEFQRGLRSCSSRLLVSEHEAFGWLARRYGLTHRGIRGMSSHSVPGAKSLAGEIKALQAEGAKAIFTELGSRPKYALMLSQETGLPLVDLQPLHNPGSQETQGGKDYFYWMRYNLSKLQKGLQCQSSK